MSFEESISEYIIGQKGISAIPKIAVKGIEEGYESESLFILAGMNRNDNPFEVKHYLELSLEELGIGLKSRFEAAKHLTDLYLNEIKQRQIPIRYGVSIIKHDYLDILESKEGREKFELYLKKIKKIINIWYNYFEDYTPPNKTKEQYYFDLDNEIILEIEKQEDRNTKEG